MSSAIKDKNDHQQIFNNQANDSINVIKIKQKNMNISRIGGLGGMGGVFGNGGMAAVATTAS